MTRYLSAEDILAVHDEMLRCFGGAGGVRDVNALNSSVGRPQSGYALFESLVRNHPFVDGNKRTAITATAVFMRLNGYKLQFTDAEAYEWMVSHLESGRLTKSAADEWLRLHARLEI